MNQASEKFIQNVWITLIARGTILLMPFVASFGTWLLWQVYTTMQQAQQDQAKEIQKIESTLQQHQFILDNGLKARLEFQNQTLQTFERLNDKFEVITNKLNAVNDSVIRVQTIVETRLPPKAAKGTDKWLPQ